MKIHKYNLTFETTQLELPIDAKILDIGIQNGVPVLWAMVDPESKNEPRIIEAFFTGDILRWPSTLDYIKTVTNTDGLVYHFFEQK